jgi:hypothetical protein
VPLSWAFTSPEMAFDSIPTLLQEALPRLEDSTYRDLSQAGKKGGWLHTICASQNFLCPNDCDPQTGLLMGFGGEARDFIFGPPAPAEVLV